MQATHQGWALMPSMVMRFFSSITKILLSRSMQSADRRSTACRMWGISDHRERTCCNLRDKWGSAEGVMCDQQAGAVHPAAACSRMRVTGSVGAVSVTAATCGAVRQR